MGSNVRDQECAEHLVRHYEIDSLSSSELEGLIDFIRDLYLWFSPSSPRSDMRDRLTRHPATKVDVLVDREDHQCAGFSVHYVEQYQGNLVMFRGGTVVRDKSRGDYKKLLDYSVDPKSIDFLTAMTQNPRVYESLRSYSMAKVAFPTINLKPSEQIKSIARHFCKVPSLDPETMIVRNVYGEIRKDEAFKTIGNPETRQMFADNLGQNDAFFVVVPISVRG